MKRRLHIAVRIAFVLYLVAVAWLCFGKFDSLPHVERTLLGIPTDKVVHFLMFLPFPILSFLAFDGYPGKHGTAVLYTILAFFAGCAFAAATECIQARLSYRTGDGVDFQADFLALAAGSLLVLFKVLRKHKE